MLFHVGQGQRSRLFYTYTNSNPLCRIYSLHLKN